MNPNSGNGHVRNFLINGDLIVDGNIRAPSDNDDITIVSNFKVSAPIKQLGTTAPTDGQALLWNDANQSWLPGAVSSPDAQIVKVFTSDSLPLSATVYQDLIEVQPNERFIMEVKVLVRDVARNEYYRYFDGKYILYRVEDNATVWELAGSLISVGSVSPTSFTVQLTGTGEYGSIPAIRIINNTVSAPVHYKIIAKFWST